MSVKFTKLDFIRESMIVHNKKYDYSLVNYTKSSEKVIIICKEHGLFEQRASNHLRGRGCYSCKKTSMYSNEKFIEISSGIHKDKYQYKKTIYNGAHNDIIITCLKHGDFRQTPSNHLSGKGCSRCAYDNNKISNFFESVNLIHDSKYTYFNDYINLRSKINIMCKKHGIFTQRAKNHIDGQGCPTCGDKFGIKENKWLDSLNVNNRQVRIGKYIVDGYDAIQNIVYEFNGDFWHGNPSVFNLNDTNTVLNKTFGELYNKTIEKENHLIQQGYNVISIWENDFDKNKIKYE